MRRHAQVGELVPPLLLSTVVVRKKATGFQAQLLGPGAQLRIIPTPPGTATVLLLDYQAKEHQRQSRCLKITEKVSFSIASGASSTFLFFSGQKFIENAKNGHFSDI